MSKCHRCDAACKYFPTEASKILDEYFDAYGIKHRESIFLCWYDGHRITEYEDCVNYKSRKGKV